MSLHAFVQLIVDLCGFLGLCCCYLWGAHECKWVQTLLGYHEWPWCVFGGVNVDVCSCIIISWPWWTLWIGLGASSWRDLVGWWCLCTWLILYVLVCLSLGHLAWLLLSHVLLKARLSPLFGVFSHFAILVLIFDLFRSSLNMKEALVRDETCLWILVYVWMLIRAFVSFMDLRHSFDARPRVVEMALRTPLVMHTLTLYLETSMT